jgi:2-dehydro-3-deoxyphosphogluconate aldolase / (4S)-4-hydroxy-2-oxoglutarate aldolase
VPDEISKLLTNKCIVAIVRLDDLSQSESIVQALLDGGIRAVEFTLTNMDSLQVVRKLRDSIPMIADGQAAIGLGSVRSVDEAESALNAGAQFLVSPFLDLRVVEQCVSRGVPIAPGAFSPTEIATAWDAGASLVKVFPARMLGPAYIRDLLAPMPYLHLMPTGGVDLGNIADYFRAGACAVGVGSSLINPKAIVEGNWSAIASAAHQYIKAIGG